LSLRLIIGQSMQDNRSPAGDIYFLRVFTNGIERHESDGLQFSSRDDVWEEASASAGEIIRDMNGGLQPGTDWRMDVSDAAGALVYRLSFRTEQF
jgi:hypothetical protein